MLVILRTIMVIMITRWYWEHFGVDDVYGDDEDNDGDRETKMLMMIIMS